MAVVQFDSLDDWARWEAEHQAAANAATQPWQWQIKAGDHLYYASDELEIFATVIEAEPESPYMLVKAHSAILRLRSGCHPARRATSIALSSGVSSPLRNSTRRERAVGRKRRRS